jgi:type IV pilus assembly protein PilE
MTDSDSMSRSRPLNPANSGFTLIEVLIVVAIVAILAALAYPSYQDHLTRSRRTEAQSMLMLVGSRQEEFHADNRTFTVDMKELGFAADPVITENGFYQVDAVACGTEVNQTIATCFVATATRIGRQTVDIACGDFTLDSRGDRGVTNYSGEDGKTPAPEPTNCW